MPTHGCTLPVLRRSSKPHLALNAVPRIKTFGEVEETTIEVIWEAFEGAKEFKLLVKVSHANATFQHTLFHCVCRRLALFNCIYAQYVHCLLNIRTSKNHLQQDFVHEEWSKDNISEFKFEGSATKGIVTDLYPTSTFQFKLIAIMEDGSESPESEIMDCDTKVANCGPKKSTCVIS